jgi:hypothetical protein
MFVLLNEFPGMGLDDVQVGSQEETLTAELRNEATQRGWKQERHANNASAVVRGL